MLYCHSYCSKAKASHSCIGNQDLTHAGKVAGPLVDMEELHFELECSDTEPWDSLEPMEVVQEDEDWMDRTTEFEAGGRQDTGRGSDMMDYSQASPVYRGQYRYTFVLFCKQNSTNYSFFSGGALKCFFK